MTRIAVTTCIQAPVEVVWNLLTDFDAYPEWNPFIRSLRGEFVVGGRVEVVLQPDGARPAKYRPTILELEPGRSFTWIGHTGFPGIFDGRHRFELHAVPDGTELGQSETFGGVLVPLLKGTLSGAERGFRKMNEELKRLSEEKTQTP